MSKNKDRRRDEKKKPGVFSKNQKRSRAELKTLRDLTDDQKGKSVIALTTG